MQAVWNGAVLAEADKSELIYIEGNWYFPKQAVKQELLKDSDTHTICHWKGQANYYDVAVKDQVNADAAWYYPQPTPSSLDIVKKDYRDYVAFWRGVEVKD